MTAIQEPHATPERTSTAQRFALNKQTLLGALRGAGAFQAEVSFECSGWMKEILCVMAFDANQEIVSISAPVVTLLLYSTSFDPDTGQWTVQNRHQDFPLVEALASYVSDVLTLQLLVPENDCTSRGKVTFQVDAGRVTQEVEI